MYFTAKGVELKLSPKGTNWVSSAGSNIVRTGTSNGDIFQGVTGDTLLGGLGDDTYHLWAISATATESTGQGNDTVYAYYWGGATLSANIENLILNGKGMTAGTGNALNNIIVAGGVAATLNGLGGDDVLVGGVGADIFVVTAGNGSDAIYSFTPGFDIVRLNGYNITNFDQIVSHSQQIGSDLKLAFANGESLVLRNVALSDLDPTDFGFALPKAPVPLGYTQMYGADRGYNAHGWYVLTNAWGAGSLKFGTDYSVDAIYNKADMTKGTVFNWAFPYVTQVAAPIKAYPNVLFGVSPQGEQINPTDTTHVFPARVGSLAGLTATHDVTMRGNVGGYNVSYDVWFTTKPDGSKPTITNELMIWVHKGDVQPFGNVIGTYVDGAFTATIYRTGTYTAVVADKDMLAGTIDIGKVIAYLQSLGIISAEEYLACINFGAEVIGGHGSITLNDLDLRVGTRGANGVVETLVTGSGSSTALAPAAPAATPAPAPAAAPVAAPADAVSAPAGSAPTATAGHDQLYGTSGADTLKGGAGDDIYHADAKDTIVELAGEGADEVRTAASTFTLSANVENLTGTGSAGQALIGNALANVITGGAGNDTLDGAGGIDTLQGGLGNDVYLADGDDIVIEAVGAGVDEVRTAAASFTLSPNVEFLTGTASTGQVLTGNGMQNIIVAGAGADTLYGGGGKDNLDGGAGNDILDGGALADTLKGGLGDDIYLTDGLDIIIEAANAGIDEVRTSVSSFTLGDNLENLTGTGSVGQTLIGNALANLITGGVGADTLDGGAGDDILDGGMGADALRGGVGNDLYFADAGDVLTEGVGAGTDEVRTAAASFTLIPNIEHLTGTSNTGQVLTGNGMQNRITGASGNDILYGMSGKDVLDGGAGDDVLDGGAFADTLKGGLGNDVFVYRSVSDSARGQSDVISDFTLGDRISLNPIDADGNAANGNQDFRFIGAAKFSGSAGELRAFADVSRAGTWFVEADTNGDRVADLAITVVTQAGHQLNAADFWF